MLSQRGIKFSIDIYVQDVELQCIFSRGSESFYSFSQFGTRANERLSVVGVKCVWFSAAADESADATHYRFCRNSFRNFYMNGSYNQAQK